MRSFAWVLVVVGSWLMLYLPVATSSVASYVGRQQQSHRPVVVCYLGSWANYRPGAGKFLIEDIDASLCTHLIYGFAKLSHDNTIAAYDPYLDVKENWGLGAYERFTGLKDQHPHLKTLLAIGGWNEGSTKYSRMAADPSTRKKFVDSCVAMLRKYGFDGLDLDWEYPAARGGKPHDKQNFVKLLKELKEAFKSHGLLLTAAVSAGKDTIDKAYDIPSLGRYLDLINLMAYDFHGGWDKTTGHNSPLYARPEEGEGADRLNVDYAVRYWLKGGAPPSKLILGMPLYGRSFTLRNASNHAFDAPISGKGSAGEFTRERGFMGYNEICHMLKKEKGWKQTLDKHVQAPYIVKGTQWIGFDDVKSIKEKVKYLQKMKLGGAMIWSLETDDFRGTCHNRKYPLLHAINSALAVNRKPAFNIPDDNNISPEDTTPQPTPPTTRSTKVTKAATKVTKEVTKAKPTVTKEVTTTEPISSTSSVGVSTKKWAGKDLTCSKGGYFRHPVDCNKFYLCQPLRPGMDAGFVSYLFACGVGTVFSQELRTCVFPRSVPECFAR